MTSDEVELTKEQKRQRRKEREFEKMIWEAHKERGTPITKKQAHVLRLKYEKRSREKRTELRRDYITDALVWRMRSGKYDESDAGVVDQKVEILPGEKKITSKSKLTDIEKTPYMRAQDEIKKLKRENAVIKKELQKQARADKLSNRKILKKSLKK